MITTISTTVCKSGVECVRGFVGVEAGGGCVLSCVKYSIAVGVNARQGLGGAHSFAHSIHQRKQHEECGGDFRGGRGRDDTFSVGSVLLCSLVVGGAAADLCAAVGECPGGFLMLVLAKMEVGSQLTKIMRNQYGKHRSKETLSGRRLDTRVER
uniref:Uncharacterized protein n=1 Tax=Ascaris lumbricoides TaxID=6252 RepID=A0A0M3HRN6_ASCLU